jgi:hypothetical protein
MEENIRAHVGALVALVGAASDSDACSGRLMGPFAKAGKCKVEFDELAAVGLKEGSQVRICLMPTHPS